MFFPDFQVSQGVLVVDTTSLSTVDVPASSFSASTKIDFSPAIYGPDLPSQPQPKNILNYLQSSNQFLNYLNGNNLFEANSTVFVVMLNPGDAPPPSPPH